jgi:glycosyltransferase involved in cell wall biosynthesis
MSLQICWLPTPPEAGYHSMDRYWRDLDRVKKQAGVNDLLFSSLLTGPPTETRAASRWRRAAAKYAIYPLRSLFTKPMSIFHLLDHSHAHVLRFLGNKGKKIATVHDLAPLRDAAGLTAGQLKRFRHGVEALRRADLILTDSNFTADDVKQVLGSDAPPIRRLLLGVDNQGFSPPRLFSKDENYSVGANVLCVGSNDRRKNLQVLPDVFEIITRELGPFNFIRVGPLLEPNIRERLKRQCPQVKVTELSDLGEDELVAVYQTADLLFFPSVLEGFGFPVIEAMAAGTPVVASNASSIPEVGGGAALYFEPTDVHTAAKLIIRVLTDVDLAGELRSKGRERALQLDWKEHLSQLVGHYRALALQ